MYRFKLYMIFCRYKEFILSLEGIGVWKFKLYLLNYSRWRTQGTLEKCVYLFSYFLIFVLLYLYVFHPQGIMQCLVTVLFILMCLDWIAHIKKVLFMSFYKKVKQRLFHKILWALKCSFLLIGSHCSCWTRSLC